MRLILATLLLFSPLALAERVCGLYQNEDFRDRVVYLLTTFDSVTLRNTSYSIQNIASPEGSKLIRGFCYCIDGRVGSDFEFPGDDQFKVLLVEKVITGPSATRTCAPFLL